MYLSLHVRCTQQAPGLAETQGKSKLWTNHRSQNQMDWKSLELVAPRNVIHAEKRSQREAREPRGRKQNKQRKRRTNRFFKNLSTWRPVGALD